MKRLGPRGASGLAEENPSFHDQPDFAQRLDILSRVALYSDEIGEEPWLNGSDAVVKVENPGVDRSCRAQRLDGGHAVIDEELQFAGLVAMGKDANVAAVGDRDAGFQRCLEGGA